MLELSRECVNFEAVSNLSNIFFDDVNQKICTVRGGGAIGVTARGPAADNVVTCRLADKGQITTMKFSPSCAVVAIQRSPNSVDFANISDKQSEPVEFSQNCKARNARILGLEWISSSEILYITDQGLELFSVNCDKRQVKSLRVYNLAINWFIYYPASQLLVASSGLLGTTLNPFLIKNAAMIKLLRFEVDLDVTPNPPKLTLLDRDVTISTIYNHIYLMVLRHSPRPNAIGAEVIMYEFSSDSQSVPKKTYCLQLGVTGKFAIHVVDNLVVVHHQAQRASLIFDIKATDGVKDTGVIYQRPLFANARVSVTIPNDISTDPERSYDPDVELYGASWVVFDPDIIIDARVGAMWRLAISLEPTVNMFDSKVDLLRFLQFRRGSKRLFLSVLKEALRHKTLRLAECATVFRRINAAYVEAKTFKQHSALSTSESASMKNALKVASFESTIIDQPDMYSVVFHPLIDEEGVDRKYLVEVLLQYLLSLRTAPIEVQPFLHEILVTSLVKCGDFQRMYQILQYRVVTDSKPLAFLMLSLETQCPSALQLALDMLSRLNTATEEIVEVLLSKHCVIPALRYVESIGASDRVNAMKFVESAWQSPHSDRHLKYTVFKYFQERSQRLKGTCRFASGDKFESYLYDFKRLYTNTVDKSQRFCDSSSFLFSLDD